MRKAQFELDVEGGSSEADEEDPIIEANKIWEMGKQLGLLAEEENAVITAIAGGFDADKSKPM